MSTKEVKPKPISRRDMLKLSVTLLGGSVLAACAQATQAPAPTSTTAPAAPEATATSAPKPSEPTATTAPKAAEPTATTAAPPKKVEGTVVIMHQRNELSEDQQKQFESDNPGIKMDFIENDLTRFFAMYAAGAPPDLYRTQAPILPSMLARKLLYDLTPYFETSTVVKLDDLAPANNYYRLESPLKVGSGPIYGMCKDFSPDFTVFAYKPAFEAAGLPVPDDTKALTYDDIVALAKKTEKKEGDRIIMWGYGYEGGWIDRIWMNNLVEIGQNLYSPGYDKIILSGNEETKKIVQYYYDLAKENLSVNPLNPSPNGWAGGDFTAGQLSMMQYGYWYSAMAETDTTRGKILMLPGPIWAGKRRDPTMTATGMIMTSAAKVPDAAWKVFEWYNGLEPAVARAKSGWGVPALKSMMSMVPQETDFQKQCFKVLQGELGLNTPPLQFNPFIGEGVIPNAYSKYLDQALRGSIKFDEMLTSIEGEVNTAIKEGIDRIMG